MAPFSALPACPSRCCCACHQQKPGFILVWVPESSGPHGLPISRPLNPSATPTKEPSQSNPCNGSSLGHAVIAKMSELKDISCVGQVAPVMDKEMNSNSGDSTESLCVMDTSQSSPELPNTEPSPCKPGKDLTGELGSRTRKPVCRKKAQSIRTLCEQFESLAVVASKVAGDVAQAVVASSPPSPLLRKGCIKKCVKVNLELLEETDKKTSANSLPVDRGHRLPSEDTNEPLYKMYPQSANKEIQQPTISHNTSLNISDSKERSMSYGGSPKQEPRSTLSQNTLWQRLPSVMESGVLESMTNDEKKLQESMFEVLTSEASYLRSLNILTEYFLECRELQETLIIRDKKILFSNILKVKEVSERFLMDLEARVDEDIVICDICDIIYHHAVHNFPVYKDYVRNQLYQEKTFSELMEKNPQFHAVICRLQERPQCQNLPFMSFLLLPFQRITRIKMLVENILNRTEEGSEAKQNASKALKVISKIMQECNQEVGHMQQMEELIHISSRIEFEKIKAIPIVSQSRFLEKQGELSEVHQKESLFKPTKLTPVYFFLFNDLLLITQKKSSDRFVVVDYAHRSLVQLQSCPTMENSFFQTLLENHQGKICDRLFEAPTQSDFNGWVAAFPSKNNDLSSGGDPIYENWDCPQVHSVEKDITMKDDELNLEPVDFINVLQKPSEGGWEDIQGSDSKKSLIPTSFFQGMTNEHVRRRKLSEEYRLLQAEQQMVNQTSDQEEP